MLGESYIVVTLRTVSNPHIVNEVEVGLPRATVVLDVISKGRALNEGVVGLVVSQSGVVSRQSVQNVEGLVERIRAVLQHQVLGNVGNYRGGKLL